MTRCCDRWCLILATALFCQCRPASADPVAEAGSKVEPKADAILRSMSRHLARAERFSFVAYDMGDQLLSTGQKIQLGNTRRIAVERPNKALADLTGDIDNQRIWYDGKTLTALDRSENVYSVIEVPDTLDQTLDYLAENYDVVMPLADLLFSNPYESAIKNVQSGQYLGLHKVQGQPCHHLAFRQDGLDWQIWIESGPNPLPRKLVLTFVQHPGQPQYIAILHKWNLAPTFKQSLFVFQRPDGAERVDVERIRTGNHEGPPSSDQRKGHPK